VMWLMPLATCFMLVAGFYLKMISKAAEM